MRVTIELPTWAAARLLVEWLENDPALRVTLGAAGVADVSPSPTPASEPLVSSRRDPALAPLNVSELERVRSQPKAVPVRSSTPLQADLLLERLIRRYQAGLADPTERDALGLWIHDTAYQRLLYVGERSGLAEDMAVDVLAALWESNASGVSDVFERMPTGRVASLLRSRVAFTAHSVRSMHYAQMAKQVGALSLDAFAEGQLLVDQIADLSSIPEPIEPLHLLTQIWIKLQSPPGAGAASAGLTQRARTALLCGRLRGDICLAEQFVLYNVAPIPAIVEAMGMSAQEFLALWPQLPLTNVQLGEVLRCSPDEALKLFHRALLRLRSMLQGWEIP